MALPYVYTAWTARVKRFSSLWTVIAGIYTFFMVLIPFIYIGYYVLFGGEMDMFAMMAVRSTHLKEIKDFLRTMGSPMHLAMAVIALGIVISCAVVLSRSMMKRARSFEGNIFRGSGKSFSVGLLVISVLFFGGFYQQITHVFPATIFKALNSSGSEFQLLQKLNDNLDKNVKTMTFLAPNPENGIDEGTHIVIIGESANRDHMKAFTPDYPENTTPWLSEMAKTKDFALGYKAYSNFPNTLFSLSYAMTSANQYSDMSFEDVVSMVDVAKAAGYRTDWISFHNRSSMSSAGVTMIAERCDDSYWEKNYDGYTLEVLKKLPPAKKRIIFINIDGSHYTYIARVPVNLRDELGISKEDPYHDYDLTIAYDDRVMKEIFEYAKANLNLKSMIYFSDHGENMKHYHTTSPFYYDMVHIPFFVYLSPDYQAAHPELMPALKSHEQQVFTNDLAFDTVTGIWQAKTNFYQSKYDFSSKDYAINMDNATTFERKNVTEINLLYSGHAAFDEAEALIIQNNLQQLGIKVNLEKVAWATFRQRADKGDFQMALGTWSPDYSDPQFFLSYWLDSSYWGLPGNRSFYKNDEVDSLLREAEVMTDKDGRTAIYKKVQQIAFDDAPYLFLFQTKVLTPMRANIKGFAYNPMLDSMYDFEHLSKE